MRLAVKLFIFLLPAVVFSQGSYLNVSLFDDTEFFVTFDNTSYNQPGSYAEFDQISPGEHNLKIIKYDATVPAQGSVLFEGKVKIPAGYDLYAVIDEYNAFTIFKKVKYFNNRCEWGCENRKKCGDKDGEKLNESYNEKADDCKYKIIKEDEYKALKKDINNRNFEATNSTVLKSAAEKNYFSSDQVRELLGFFTFEDSKLDIAKALYPRVCDKNNFFKVYSAFSFDSSVEELKNYISGK
jgi:hypothetical protein